MKTFVMFILVAVLSAVGGLWLYHEVGYRPQLLALGTISLGSVFCGLSALVRQLQEGEKPSPPSERYLPRAGEDFPEK